MRTLVLRQIGAPICPPIDAPPHSLKYSNANPKVETFEKGEVGVRSLICNILGGRKARWNCGMGIRTSDKQVNYS